MRIIRLNENQVLETPVRFEGKGYTMTAGLLFSLESILLLYIITILSNVRQKALDVWEDSAFEMGRRRSTAA